MTDETTEKGYFDEKFEELLRMKKEEQMKEVLAFSIKEIIRLLRKL